MGVKGALEGPPYADDEHESSRFVITPWFLSLLYLEFAVSGLRKKTNLTKVCQVERLVLRNSSGHFGGKSINRYVFIPMCVMLSF